jgi:hypothetical protein
MDKSEFLEIVKNMVEYLKYGGEKISDGVELYSEKVKTNFEKAKLERKIDIELKKIGKIVYEQYRDNRDLDSVEFYENLENIDELERALSDLMGEDIFDTEKTRQLDDASFFLENTEENREYIMDELEEKLSDFFENSEPAFVICPHCGKKNSPYVVYCSKCGGKL